jgi:predicted transcriptional regulator
MIFIAQYLDKFFMNLGIIKNNSEGWLNKNLSFLPSLLNKYKKLIKII